MSKTDTQVTSLDDEGADVAVAAPTAVKPRAAAKAAPGAPLNPHRMVTLVVHQGTGDGGNDAVYVGVNEYGRLIPRGVPVEVPATVIGSLDLAVQEVYITEGKTTTARQVPRYAYTVRE